MTLRLGPYAAVEWSFHVETDSQPLASAIGAVLAPLTAPAVGSGADAHAYSLTGPHAETPGRLAVDDVLLVESPDASLLYCTLLWHVNRGVEQASSRHVLLHASAAERDGVAVVLAAPMDSGKTTLVAGLVSAGLRYLTDETVALRPSDGCITPYPKALSVDVGSWAVLAHLEAKVPPSSRAFSPDQWQVPVEAASTGARPRLLVLPRYAPGGGSRLDPIPRSEALVELMHQRFAPARDPRRDMAVLAQVLRSGACYRLVTDQLDDAVELVVSALADFLP